MKKGHFILIIIITLIFSSVFGFFAGSVGGFVVGKFMPQINNWVGEMSELKDSEEAPNIEEEAEGESKKEVYISPTSQEQMIVGAVKKVSPAVVSIIVTKDLPVLEQIPGSPFEEFFGPDNDFFQFFSPFDFQIPQYRQKGTQKKEVGGGSGFIVSKDGLILTNKHVVSDENAEYTVLTNEGEKIPAKVLARDPFQDIAILKVEKTSLPTVVLGDSDQLDIGQTVIAIGNALGEFRNTVSVGVISGLKRNVTASGGGVSEEIENVIQTDAAINPGNSGGPLLNLRGEVIGVNVAMASGAENIGFSLPINIAKKQPKVKIGKTTRKKETFKPEKIGEIFKIVSGKKPNLPILINTVVVKGGKVFATDLESALIYDTDKDIGEAVLPIEALKGKTIDDIEIGKNTIKSSGP